MADHAASRNLAAECRAVEEGHQARISGDGQAFVVVSNHPDAGHRYRVTAHAGVDSGRILFECVPVDKQTGRPVDEAHGLATAAPGVTPCKHAARVARRLVREGVASFDGSHWTARPEVVAELQEKARAGQPDDPFDGLGSVSSGWVGEARTARSFGSGDPAVTG